MCVCTFRAINSWNISPKHALAINRHILMTRFGHLAAFMWARLILSRFHDAVLPDYTFTSADSGAYFNAFSSDSSRGVYHLRADMSQVRVSFNYIIYIAALLRC